MAIHTKPEVDPSAFVLPLMALAGAFSGFPCRHRQRGILLGV
jgi:hypothetical protein